MLPKGDSAKLEKDLVIILGAFDVVDAYETGRQSVIAKQIIIQDEYNSKDYNRFTGDVAMVILTEKVQFTELIKPICLLAKGQADDYEGPATVAGWGVTEQGATEGADTASLIEIPIISNEKCYREESKLASIGWDESFCAGKEGIGVCSGDSGSGIYVEINGKYYIKGVVSAAINGGGCGGSKFAIFTDLTKYDLSIEGRLRNLNKVKQQSNAIATTEAPKVIECGRIPEGLPKKLFENQMLSPEDVPFFVEITADKYTVLGIFLAPDKIITSHQPKVSSAPLTINVGGVYVDKLIKKVMKIPNKDGDTTIGTIVILSSPVKELEDLPCLLPNFYTPSIDEEIFSFDETIDDEQRRQMTVGRNVAINKCDTSALKEPNMYCLQLPSEGAFPNFAFVVKDGKLALVGVFRMVASLIEKGKFFDVVTFKAISSENVPVKYP